MEFKDKMDSKPDFRGGNPRLFPGRGSYEFALQFF